MARRRKKAEGELRLSSKKHPRRGIASTCFAILSILLFGAACIYSGTLDGKAGMEIGIAGLACIVISITGFVFAWLALHEENIKAVFPTVGILLNGLLVILYMILYLLGSLM